MQSSNSILVTQNPNTWQRNKKEHGRSAKIFLNFRFDRYNEYTIITRHVKFVTEISNKTCLHNPYNTNWTILNMAGVWKILTYCTLSAVLVRLQNTPLCLWHCFIADSTSRRYNLSLQCVQTPWCLVSGRSFDVFSSRRLLANWLTSRRNL
jgi:hypothetical protein